MAYSPSFTGNGLQSSQLMRSRKVDLGLTFQRYLDYSVQGLPHRCCRNGVLSGREFRKEPGTVRDSFEDFFPVDVFNQDISSAEIIPFVKDKISFRLSALPVSLKVFLQLT
jgi:hypothetical protein